MAFRTPGPAGVEVEEETSYWMPFSDMMAGLLIVFILLTLALLLQLSEKQDRIDTAIDQYLQAEEARRSIIQSVKERLLDAGIAVETSENDSVLQIPTDALGFKRASFRIRDPEAVRRARLIGEILYEELVMDARTRFLDTVFVEGHTDLQRYFDRDFGEDGNWPLSAKRAVELWLLWRNSPEESPVSLLSELNNSAGQRLFSVSGYAGSRVRVDGDLLDESVNQRNRRIEVRITIRRPSERELRAIREGQQ